VGSELIMIGILILIIIIALYLLGVVGVLSIAGAIVFMIFGLLALVFDETYDKPKRIAFIILALCGIVLIIYDVILS
jgi:hypothetical protein